MSRDKPRGGRATNGPASRWQVISLVLLLASVLATPARADAPPPNVPVTPTGGSLAFQDPTLALDPTNHAHLAIAYYEYSQGRQCSLALSSDAGKTWSTKVVVGDGGQIPLAVDQVKCVSPKIAYGPSGAVYYIYQAPRPQPPGPFVFTPRQVLIATSHDGGATFGAPVLLGLNTDRFVYAQVAVAVDQTSGRVYAAWTDKTNPTTGNPDPASWRVRVASSADEGRTFSAPVQAAGSNPLLYDEGPEEPSLVVDPDHTLHVAWRVFLASPDLHETVQKLVASSKDQGQTFGAPSVALSNLDPGCIGGTAECRRPVEYAADNVGAELARGTSPGQLFAVGWGPEGGVYTNNRRLLFSVSRDGGATWSAARSVGIPAGHESDDQGRPSLTVTPTGRIEIVYQNLPTTEGGVQNIFEIHSDDGGSTFSAPGQLNAAPSDIRIGPPSFSTFNGGNTAGLGAHSGVASSESAVFTAWTDTSRGTLDTGKQDIFVASLPLPAPAGPTPGPTPSGPAASTPPGPTPRPPAPRIVSRGQPRLSSRVTKRRHRVKTTFHTTGRLFLPKGFGRSACRGTISIQIKHRTRTVSRRRIALKPNCTFSQSTAVLNYRLRGRGRNQIIVRYQGTRLLKPASAGRRFA